MEEFIKKLQEKCPNWNIKEQEYGLEIHQYTDAGEDFSFEVEGSTPKELSNAMYNYYQGFDPEDHVKMWIEAEKNGVKGVPSLFVLVEDSKKLEEDLEDLGVRAYRIAEELENENNKTLDKENIPTDEKLIKKLEKEIKDFKNEHKELNESNAYDLVLYDTAYMHIVDKIEDGSFEDKDLEKILNNENILEEVRNYYENTIVSDFTEAVKISTDALLNDILNSSKEEQEQNVREKNANTFYNLLNFINNNEKSRTNFNNAKNGMFINKDDNTNVVLFVEYDEGDLGNRETFIFGNEENVTKYLVSLKEHSIEIAWSDGLTDRQNKAMIEHYEKNIESVLEDIRVANADPNKIYFIYEEDNSFELKTTKETEEELNKIENKIQKIVNEETKQTKKQKSYEEEM